MTESGKGMVGERTRVAVVGIGNVLLKDEGIGVHVVRALQEVIGDTRPDIELIDGGTSPDCILSLQRVRKLVLVDAARGGGPPGSVYRFRPDDIQRQENRLASVHQVNLLDSLRLLKLTGPAPEEVVIIGIEPAEIDWGMELTPRLLKKLPDILKAVMDEIIDTK